MKNTCLVISSICGAIIVGLVILGFMFLPGLFKMDKEATAYISDAVPKIAAHWDGKELSDRATPELLSELKADDALERTFIMFKRLGALKHLDTPTGGVNTFTNGSGTTTTGNYEVHGDFENGPALLKIQLRRVGEAWRINGFHINSNALLPPKPEAATKEAPAKDPK